MKKTIIALTFLILTYSLFQVASAQQQVCVYYFWGMGCPHCANVKPFIEELEQKYPTLDVKEFEIYHNYSNYQLFNEYCSAYETPNKGVPFAIVNGKYMMGENSIKNNLEEEIISCLEEGCECPTTQFCGNVTDGDQTGVSPAEFKEKRVTIPLIILAGLTDGINPCAFAVLIFLLTYLLSIGSRKRIITIGTIYILAVYVSYFLAGLGLFTVIQLSGFTMIIYRVAAVIAIIVGLVNMKDFFWYSKGITMKIPSFGKPSIEKFTRMATLPSALILGFLVSMLELPCTGGVYLAILGLLANQTTRLSAIPYLLLYNLMFILPLIVILFLIYYGLSPERAEKWRKKKRKWMKLIAGSVMLGLGIWMLIG